MSAINTAELTEVQAAARSVDLQAQPIATGLYNVGGTWCLVYLTSDRDGWKVRRRLDRLGPRRKWKTIYRGPSLTTAFRKATEWKR
jgi:hypothetical protein